MKIAAVDIGGTSLRIGMTERTGGLSFFEKHPQSSVLGGAPLENLAKYVREYLGRNGENTAALVLALPGTIGKDKATVLSVPNVKGFNGVNVKAYLQERLGFPVFLIKDVSALLYYDIERFGISDEGVTIACYIGTGIGNAIYIDGKIHEGGNGSAGELGHIPVSGLDAVCTCGNTGCAEMRAGGKYLEVLLHEYFPYTPIEQIFQKHSEHPVVVNYIKLLAATIATEINILDPETVILGGGVISMDGFPKERLEQFIRFHSRKPYPERGLRFLYSPNNGENGVTGAGLYGWNIL